MTYTTSGDYNYISGNGLCNDTITLHLTISNGVHTDTTAAACGSFTWNRNGVTYTTSGDYNYITANGLCNDTLTLHLTISNGVHTDTTAAACGSFTWSRNGVTYTTSGNYNYITSNGMCTDTLTLHLTITNGVHTDTTAVACGSFTWSRNGVTYTTSGNYNYTISNGLCTDTVTLHLTINNGVHTDTTATACGSFTWNRNGVTYTTSGDYNYTFTNGQGCQDTVTLHLTIQPAVAPVFSAVGPLCQNSTAPVLPTTSNNGITGTWNPVIISTNIAGTFTYTFTPTVGQCATTATLSVTIDSLITPLFAGIGPLCQNSVAPVLPLTSSNGITGTWNPATINTTTTGTLTYTFTPTAGQCARTATMTITVTTNIVPTFSPIAAICSGAAIVLPTTSIEGITGTWIPAVNNMTTTTYTFTPDAGQCASPTTMTVTVNPNIAPVFTAIGPLCQNSVAPILPLTSTNGITGTWSPATINTATSGTTTYTFTPTPGLCATTATLSVTIDPQITPAFTAIGPLCQNSTAPVLPTTSSNGITGTWSPATISTTTAGTTVYTFTPTAGVCATTATLSVTIDPLITPAFTAIGPLCQNTAAPVLPATSNNGITGTWSPATISTTVPGTITYTFTPTAGQCATTATLSITTDPLITPAFTALGPLCQNTVAPVLPLTSTNGITGIWSPATINTAAPGTTTYTFTPTAGQCATTATMTITVDPLITPVLNAIGPLCQSSTAPVLPLTSANGITGTWSPATINTSTPGTFTYTFTPTAGLCATTATLSVRVNPIVFSTTDITICTLQLPYTWNGTTFTAAGSYVVRLQSSFGCDSMARLNLQVKAVLTSTTTISICASQVPYVWNGQSYTQPGTYTYKQTTQAGCDSIATLILDITPLATVSVSGGGTICKGGSAILNLTFTGTGPWTLVYTNGTTSDTIVGIAASPYQITVTPAVTTTYRITSVADVKCTNISVNSSATVTVVASQQGIRYTTQLALTNQPRQLQARSLGNGYNYTWTPPVGLNFYNIYNPVFNFNRTTEYLISLKNNSGCLTVDTLLVKVLPGPTDSLSNIFVPKAWTPNGDGRNDVLVPIPVNIRELKFFRVFNRWGQLVFETNQLLHGWDGMFKGKPHVMDVFTWTAEAIGNDGQFFRKAGNAALLR